MWSPVQVKKSLSFRLANAGCDASSMNAVRPADVSRTAADYGVEPIWFPGMGHDVMLDRGWEDVLATVLDFAGHLPAWGTAPPR